MIRGTTPVHVFQFPEEVTAWKKIRVTYKQFGEIVLEKTEADVKTEGKTVSLTLTQEETLKFHASSRVQLQVKVLTNTGAVLASPIREIKVEEILNTEVLA